MEMFQGCDHALGGRRVRVAESVYDRSRYSARWDSKKSSSVDWSWTSF